MTIYIYIIWIYKKSIPTEVEPYELSHTVPQKGPVICSLNLSWWSRSKHRCESGDASVPRRRFLHRGATSRRNLAAVPPAASAVRCRSSCPTVEFEKGGYGLEVGTMREINAKKGLGPQGILGILTKPLGPLADFLYSVCVLETFIAFSLLCNQVWE